MLTRVQSRWRRYGAIGLLLAAMAGLEFDCLHRESVTIDEPLHFTAGYMASAFGDYRLQESAGVLPSGWFALPALASGVEFPSRDDEAWRQPGNLGLRLTNQVFFNPHNDLDTLVFRGRIMAVIVSLLCAIAVYAWAARLFGVGAGLVAGFFCALNPTMLAHGHLMTSDVPAALAFLLGAGCFWSLLRRFTPLRLAASATACGLLLVTKMSGALIVPMIAMMFLARAAGGRPWPVRWLGAKAVSIRTWRGKSGLLAGAIAAHALVALTIVWSCYGWHDRPSRDWDARRDDYTEPRAAVFASLGRTRPLFALAERSQLLPDAYLYGLAHTVKHAAQRPAFLNGEYRTTGWWYYFPYCFLVKTPLPLMAAVAFGAAAIATRARRRARFRRAAVWAWLDRTSLLWSIVLVYGAAALSTDLNIGHRHLLPLYLPLFILAGASAWWLVPRILWLQAAVLALLLLNVGVVARSRPHYLAYFNELAGGPSEGYRHLTDSNVDWGQDLPSLAAWLREHQSSVAQGEVYLSWFGYDAPQRWGIHALSQPDPAHFNPRFSSANPVTFQAGTYCFSATYLMMPGPPWDDEREREYRGLLSRVGELEATPPTPANESRLRDAWAELIALLADRQYDRLRSRLISRQPDAMIGNSILIFRLTAEDLRAALLP